MRRVPAVPARLRGRAARGRRRGRHRVLPRGDQRDLTGPVRRLARRGLDHQRARRRANPPGAETVEDADHDRRLRDRRRDPGAEELRRRQRVRLDRLRLARVHLDARHLDCDRRPRAGRLRAARLPDRQAPAARGGDRLPARPPPERTRLLGLHGVQAARDDVRHGRPRDAVPRAGHPGRLRRDLPGVRARLLRVLRADGDAEHGVALEAAARARHERPGARPGLPYLQRERAGIQGGEHRWPRPRRSGPTTSPASRARGRCSSRSATASPST